jgi:hypothetical protein
VAFPPDAPRPFSADTRQNEEGAASTAKFEGDLGDDDAFDFMDAGLDAGGLLEGVEDEHSGDAPPGMNGEHNSGVRARQRGATMRV